MALLNRDTIQEGRDKRVRHTTNVCRIFVSDKSGTITQATTFITTETQRTQRMGITWVATARRDVARLWEQAATHVVHSVTLHSVVGNVMLFILTVSLHDLLTA
ncbi:MAG TPA: hypothetical protein DEF43_07395 [Chloroflexus aurantiacus]|nr:MAG: hypothetical protein D6716_06270 [Chloroflexota bacterium]HBW66981.1 hypothetical protein [Chloroflexus aurantiacus]